MLVTRTFWPFFFVANNNSSFFGGCWQLEVFRPCLIKIVWMRNIYMCTWGSPGQQIAGVWCMGKRRKIMFSSQTFSQHYDDHI